MKMGMIDCFSITGTGRLGEIIFSPFAPAGIHSAVNGGSRRGERARVRVAAL